MVGSTARVAAETGRLTSSIPGFFCQAEGSIRDIGVTGVQTCALPISYFVRFEREHAVTRDERVAEKAARYRELERRVPRASDLVWCASSADKGVMEREAPGVPVERSEERRVGKECRSRRSPYH